MCMRVHERWKIGGARSVDEAGGGRKRLVVMENSVC